MRNIPDGRGAPRCVVPLWSPGGRKSFEAALPFRSRYAHTPTPHTFKVGPWSKWSHCTCMPFLCFVEQPLHRQMVPSSAHEIRYCPGMRLGRQSHLSQGQGSC